MILQWHQSPEPPPPFPDECPACGASVETPQKYGVPGATTSEQWAAACTSGHVVSPDTEQGRVRLDEGLIELLTQRRDALRAERVRKEEAREVEALDLQARYDAFPQPGHGKGRRYAEAHASSPVQLRIIPAAHPMPAEYRCPVTHALVKPLAVLPTERRGPLQVIWWYCSVCDRNKRRKGERLFNRDLPAPHVLILAADTLPPPVLVSVRAQKRLVGVYLG